MASSSSKKDISEDDEAIEEELERFDDFTLASSWERFISEIEAVCRLWLADGPKNLLEKGAVQLDFFKNLYKVKSELKHAMKSYWMEYYFEKENSGQVADWNGTLHDVQMCFGVKDFLLIAPQSASGVVLDAPESSKLLSAVAIALTNCSSYWPAFVPVHDPSRTAYIGIQNMGTVFTRRFEADLIGSQVPVKLMHLEGLYDLFISKFAYSMVDISMRIYQVCFTMKLTYRTLPYGEDDDIQGVDSENERSGGDLAGEMHNRIQWDEVCPWSEWYSTEDPVKGFDLITIWSEKTIESSLEMAEMENASPYEAEKWLLLPILSESSKGDRIGFASQLRLLVDALLMSFEAQFMEDFVSVENHGSDSMKSSMVIPPPSVLDRVLKELFHEGKNPPNLSKGEHKSSRAIKGAPLRSLFAQFCLHALWIGNCNIRAVAVLWVEFVREVRWCWEEYQSLPHMSTNGSIDLSTCLINQKLEMLRSELLVFLMRGTYVKTLSICIEMKREMNEEYQDCDGSMDESYGHHEENGQVRQSFVDFPVEEHNEKYDSLSVSGGSHYSGTKISKTSTGPEERVSSFSNSSDHIRKGSSGVLGSMLLLRSPERMHAPFTQKPPPMTEDMHEERLHAVEAFADSFNTSAHLEKDVLSSDMSSFKAANPEAVFEDFIRWHSPGDWENDSIEESGSSSSSTPKDVNDDWPPQGRLSKRMSEQGNLWRKLWNDAAALSAYEQKPLLDPDLEGEKVLHYLETLQPHQLLEQMVCTAFRASADTLNQTDFGGFKLMTTKIEQLYHTMVSVLRPLKTGDISGNIEIIDDLKRLCVVFEHVDKLLTTAASLHRKLLQAPRLSEAIFSDYFKIYIPRMGSGSVDIDTELTAKQEVKLQERLVISDMFTPPTANQSWRKVISMGNLLNGHEPIVREIIFSMTDDLSGSHYASHTGQGYQDIETHRMYICGTSNDLRVALSVSSCD